MSKPLIIGVDSDGCLYDHVEKVLRYLRNRWNIIVQRNQVYTHNMCQLTTSPEANQDIVEQIKNPNFYIDMKPIEGAYQAMSRLSKIAKLIVISNRPHHTRQITEMCLARDFLRSDLTQSMFLGVHLAQKTPKWKTAYCNKVSFAIEDNPRIAEEYSKHKIACFLLGGVGNIRPSRYLKSVSSLSEVVSFFEERYNVDTSMQRVS